MALNTNEQPCCNDPVPCTECGDSLYDRTCSVILNSSCVLYNSDDSSTSLVQCLGIENGVTLTTVLEALCAKINATTAVYNTDTFNLSCLRGEYNMTDLKSVIEAITNKLCKNTNDIVTLTNYYNQLNSSIDNVLNFLQKPNITYLYNIGIEEGDSITIIISKIVNIIGAILDNGSSSSSPSIKTVNTNSIAFATAGTLNHTLTANVVIAPNADNLLRITATGLYVAPVKQVITFDPVTRKVCLSNNGGCFILPPEPDFNETSLVGNSSNTITILQSGIKGHTFTAHVNIDKVLEKIFQTATLKEQFCKICAPTNCTGQSTVATWTDTTEVRCTGPDLEKKQIDTNTCSSTYNQSRWVIKQANANVCGTTAPDYCISYNCIEANCFNTSSQNCQSVQICLKDKNTGQLIAAIEDLNISYVASLNGTPQTYNFTLTQGFVSAEGQCHCSPVGNPNYVLGSIQAVGQTTNNNGRGYNVCNIVYPRNITLTADCPNNAITVAGTIHALSGKTLKLFKDNVLYTTISNLDPNTDNFSRTITSVVENGVYRATIEDNTDASKFATTQFTTIACFPAVTPTQPNFTTPTIVADCNAKTLTTSGTFGNYGSVNIELYKDGNLFAAKTNITAPNYTATFDNINQNAYYYFTVYDSANTIIRSSNVYNYTCSITPTPTPTNPSLQATIDCTSNSVTVSGSYPQSNRIYIYLVKNDGTVVDSKTNISGANYSIAFTNVYNGSYHVDVIDQADNSLLGSTDITLSCSNEPTTNPNTPIQQPSITLTNDCTNKKLTVNGYLSNNNGVVLELYKDGVVYNTVNKITGTSFNWIFDVPTNGSYYVKAFEDQNGSNLITSTVTAISCSGSVTNPTPTLNVSLDCDHDIFNVYGSIITGSNVTVQLLQSNGTTVINSINTTTGPDYAVNFYAPDGDYQIKVFNTDNTASTKLSGVITMPVCNGSTPAPVTPPSECQRPTNLPSYLLKYATTPYNGSTSEFSSLEDACSKGEASYTVGGTNSSYISIDVASLTVGADVYLNADETNCNRAPDKYYFVTSINGSNTEHKSIKVTNGKIESIQTCTVTPVTPTTPAPVQGDGFVNTGATAINFIVESGTSSITYDYDIYLKMTTQGLEQSNQSIKVSTVPSERFMGGTTVENSLALMSTTHSQTTGNSLFYYSAAISLVNLKNRYPNQEIVEFDFLASSKVNRPQRASRINVSAIESTGIVAKPQSTATGLDYDYASGTNPDTAGGYWIVYPNSNSDNVIPYNNLTVFLRVSVNLNTRRITFTQVKGFDSTKPVTMPKTSTI